jgi:Family of unknown function (DUF6714)
MTDNHDTTPLSEGEMKARGYDPDTIAAVTRRAERLASLKQEGEQICTLIEEAFSGVILGDGVGIREAYGLDDYADADTLAILRAQDERVDWRRLLDKPANLRNSMSFLDAEGMRFHLPAALIAEIRDPGWGIEYSLIHIDEHQRSKFALLSHAQRVAVCRFLEFIAAHPDYTSDRPEILNALTEYWTIA